MGGVRTVSPRVNYERRHLVISNGAYLTILTFIKQFGVSCPVEKESKNARSRHG